MNYRLKIFDKLKADYFERNIYQFTLDYFNGSPIIQTFPSDNPIFQTILSPDLSPNWEIMKEGMVARSDSDVVVARVNVVGVPVIDDDVPVIDDDIKDKVYKVTYPVTNNYIYLGNNIGNRCITMTVHNPRQLRALAILSSGIDAIKRINKNYYQVRSQSKDGYYQVKFKRGLGWGCNCPNFKKWGLKPDGTDCKHIYASQFSAKLRLNVEREVNPDNTLTPHEIIHCPECKGYDIVKNAIRHSKKGDTQRYLCRECKHRFVADRSLSRLKASHEVVSVCMALYFKGNILANIKHHLKMFYKLSVSRPTIMRWVHRFSNILDEYSQKHKPDVGDIWNSDEMVINIRKKGEKKNLEWIWNLMDSETRFLLASTITHKRSVQDARNVLRTGKDRSGKKPRVLITDGLTSYSQANKKEFYTNTNPTIHFRTPSKRKYFLNQNIERLNGTIRERLKVMRGLDSIETAQSIINGERFYYNHIKPHEGLDGLTPAQVAGLISPVPDENPWITYLLKAIREKEEVSS